MIEVMRGIFGLSELISRVVVQQLVRLSVHHKFCPLSRGFIVVSSCSTKGISNKILMMNNCRFLEEYSYQCLVFLKLNA